MMRTHLMKSGSGQLWYLTTEKGLCRDRISKIQRRISRLQRDAGFYVYNMWIFETRPNLHAHFIFIGDTSVRQKLEQGAFGRLITIKSIYDLDGLLRKYHAKERTPQAGWGRERQLGGRIEGSHRIDGGGDRVHLSRELERDAIEAKQVQPWQHTNARRTLERNEYRKRALTKKSLRPAGQIPLLPEMEKPVSRLRHFGGGTMPPAVALEIEFLRKQKGLSQCQLANLIGRSQGQYANAIRGHDPISAASVNRLRDVLLAESNGRTWPVGMAA
jgi:hypothetical protein